MKTKEKKGFLFGMPCTIIEVDAGDTVLCDLCNKDYTNDNVSEGGMLFSGKAVCPECLEEFLLGVRKYREEKYIKAVAKHDELFRDFVYRVRREF